MKPCLSPWKKNHWLYPGFNVPTTPVRHERYPLSILAGSWTAIPPMILPNMVVVGVSPYRSKRDTLRKLWEVLGACIVELTVDWFDISAVGCQDRSRKEVILALVGNKIDLEAKTNSKSAFFLQDYLEVWDDRSASLTLNSFWGWLWLSFNLQHLATRAISQVIQVLDALESRLFFKEAAIYIYIYKNTLYILMIEFIIILQ